MFCWSKKLSFAVAHRALHCLAHNLSQLSSRNSSWVELYDLTKGSRKVLQCLSQRSHKNVIDFTPSLGSSTFGCSAVAETWYLRKARLTTQSKKDLHSRASNKSKKRFRVLTLSELSDRTAKITLQESTAKAVGVLLKDSFIKIVKKLVCNTLYRLEWDMLKCFAFVRRLINCLTTVKA